MSETKHTSHGVGVVGLLGVSFVVLKLCGIINWSWWWVTAPFWAPAALVSPFVVLALGLWIGVVLFKPRKGNK